MSRVVALRSVAISNRNMLTHPARGQAAIERQVIARAHRMGATGPVAVETMKLWDGERDSGRKSAKPPR